MSSLAILLAAGFLVGCGVVGPPIPPEDVGVARTVAEQKRRDAQQQGETESQVEAEPQGQDVNLPPLRPVGTR